MRKQSFDSVSSAEKKQFQQKVLAWYKENKRDLPWRKTTDPYKILVSEVMLQQTQVVRVIPKYTNWLEKRPTLLSFAQATREEVLSMWSWLGFNRRWINLHEACKRIVSDACGAEKQWKQLDFQQISDKMWDNCGKLVSKNMQDYAYLLSLSWVGDYTANAILAFSYNFEVPVLDINIKRVIIHTFWLPENVWQFDLQSFALSLVPLWKSRERHNALMDYGSMVLHSKATGIQSPKQSTFKWSDREVRGWILKQLVGNAEKKYLKLQVGDVQAQFPTKDVQKIIAWLQKEGIVTVNRSVIQLG